MKVDAKIEDLSVDDLKNELKKRKIAQLGPKVALIKKLKKALTDEGEDPETYIFNKPNADSDKDGPESKTKGSSKGDSKQVEPKTPAPTEETGTPKRSLRRTSARETSPALTPSKTRTRGRQTKKLATLEEESKDSESKDSTEEEKEIKEEEPPKKETGKRVIKKGEEAKKPEPKKSDEGKDVAAKTDKQNSVSPKKKDSVASEVSSESKESIAESGKATLPAKEENSCEEDKDSEEAMNIDLDIKNVMDLEEMEQPDYEEELNFECGSTYISDNDADLEASEEKKKRLSKSSDKSADDSEDKSATDSDAAGKKDTGNETGEQKEKIKSAKKSTDKSDKEESRTAERNDDEKEETPVRDLWVTGLSNVTKAADLKQAFLKHAKVISTKIVMNPKMPGSQCFGIVTVASPEDAAVCIKALNSTELLGRFITIKMISKKKKKEDDAKKSDSKDASENDKKPGSSEGKDKDSKADLGIKGRLGPRVGPMRRRSRSPRFNRDRGAGPYNRGDNNARWQDMERMKAARRRMAIEEEQRKQAYMLGKEREMLRMERERIEREKAELLRLERERLEREKEEIRKQHMRLEEERRKREFMGGRDEFEIRNKRAAPMNDRYNDRRSSPSPYHSGPPIRREGRPSGRFESRGDRYNGDERREGWSGGRDEGWSGGDHRRAKEEAPWNQNRTQQNNRSWNGNNGSSRGGRGGYAGSRGGRGGGGGRYGSDSASSSMNPYPPPQQSHQGFNPYPPPRY